MLEHGADPNVRCGAEDEAALHLAARIGQSPPVVRLLLARGADVRARRADGRTAWMLAARAGFGEIVDVLELAGASREPLGPVDSLLAACGRGDVDAARARSSPKLVASLSDEERMTLPHAAAAHRDASVLACLAAGIPVDSVDDGGATALHHAAIRGRAVLVRALLAAHPNLAIRDRHHGSSALGWACYSADFVRDDGGAYVECVRLLTDAGARFVGDEWRPRDGAVMKVLLRAGVT